VVIGGILRIGWLRVERGRVLLRRRNRRRVVDLDVSNRVPLHAVALQTMAGRWEVDYGTCQLSTLVRTYVVAYRSAR
jgi:hypothetical protein